MQQVTYEQPLNETIRACLRLEYLFAQLKQCEDLSTPLHPISVILDILSVIDRPDLKGKLMNLLGTQEKKLKQLVNHPNVDTNALEEMLQEIIHLRETLHTQHHLASDLMQHVFFKSLRQQSVHPGGLAQCNAPSFTLWQHQPLPDQLSQLKEWLNILQPLKNAVLLILQLTRSSAKLHDRHTESGFYQEKVNSEADIQLIRIQVPQQILPEISAGPHLLVIHFTCPQFLEDDYIATPTTHVPFRLACCKEIF